jgi:hypothetical protein
MTAAVQVPDWSQTTQRLVEGCQVFTDARTNFTQSAANSFINQESIILSDGVFMDSDVDTAYKAGLIQTRQAYSNAIASAAALFSPCLLEYTRVLNNPQQTPGGQLPQIYQYMSTGLPAVTYGAKYPPKVNSRNISYGSATAAAANVGNGTINRLNVGPFGEYMESGFCETRNFQCFADSNSGTNPGQEQFNALGQPFRDAMQRYQAGYGSGVQLPVGALIGITGDTTSAYFLNPSFAQGGGSPFSLTNWTIVSGGSNLSLDTVHYYRASAIEQGTPASLKATGSFQITQTLSARNGSLNAAIAYYTQLAINGTLGSWSGSVQVTIGNLTWTTNWGGSGWVVSAPTFNDELYFQNFNAAGLAVTITGTVNSGYVEIDDFLFAPWTTIGGFSYALVGGSTNFQVNGSGGDAFQITDTQGTTALVQDEISESYAWYLPAVIQASGGAAPSAALASHSGGMTVGYHGFAYAYFNSTTGIESLLSASVFIGVSTGNTQVNLTGVTTGPTGTTARNIYATRVTSPNDQPVWYFAHQIADNSTTTYSGVTTADAALLLAPQQIPDPTA